jgi:ribosomal protein L7/L12
MNKTKKRAAKRAASKPSPVTTPKRINRRGFKWPHPLTAVFKIHNLKAYRDYFACPLIEAKAAVEAAMPESYITF